MRCSVVTATLLAVPVLAAPLPQHIRHTEVVTLPVPVGEDGFEIQTFQLALRALLGPGPCLASPVSLNRHALHHGLGGRGSGVISLGDHQIVQAHWAYDCRRPDAQHLRIGVDAVNGQRVDGDVHLDVTIQRPHRSAHPGIVVVTVPTRIANDDAAHVSGLETDEAPLFQISPPHHQAAAAEIPLSVPPSTGKARSKRLRGAVTPDFVSGAIFASLALSLLSLAVMSCLCCFGPVFRPRRGDGEKDRVRRRELRRERKAARKQAVAEFFSYLFARAHEDGNARDGYGGGEEKSAEAEQRKLLDDSSDDEASVADDLAGLRSVADMVGDMVAAEEGRAKYPPARLCPHRHHCHYEQQPPQHLLEGRSTPEFYDDDESLPAYEEQAPDQAVVADGFQYQPSCDGQQLPLPRPGEAWEDRLGYDK